MRTAAPGLRQDGDDVGVTLALRPAVTAAQHRPVAYPTLRSGAAATFAAYWRSGPVACCWHHPNGDHHPEGREKGVHSALVGAK